MGNKLERKFNGDLHINARRGRRDRGRPFDRDKEIRRLMREEGLSWREAEQRLSR